MVDQSQRTVETRRVFQWWDYAIYTLFTVAQLIAICFLFSYWFRMGDWRGEPVTFSILTLLLASVIIPRAKRWVILPRMRRPVPMPPKPGWNAGVVTTFVPGAESIEMLEKTVTALVEIDYPHDTWVLDEGDSDEVKVLCARLGAFHFSRKDMPQYQTKDGLFQSRSKHGNYNAWLYETGFNHYQIIAGFDPDHVPDADFLSRVIGYFEDGSVGYVQLPQAYYNQTASFIARGAAEETYPYYSSSQQAAYGGGWPVITGCHHTHRVTALKEVGGFPAHDADDLLITFLYLEKGWKGVYVPEILARGITPVDWHGYLKQQLRWARSVLDIKLRILPKMKTGLRLVDRVFSLLHGLSYIKDVFTLLGILLLGWMLATGTLPFPSLRGIMPVLLAQALIFFVADFYRQRFFLDIHSEWGLHWRAIVLRLAKWPFIVMALVLVILNPKTDYALTLKVKGTKRRYVLLWPHLGITMFFLCAWAIGVFTGSSPFPTVILWSAVIVTVSLLLIVTEFTDFPDPYDDRLYSTQRQQDPHRDLFQDQPHASRDGRSRRDYLNVPAMHFSKRTPGLIRAQFADKYKS